MRSWPKPSLGSFSMEWGSKTAQNLLNASTLPEAIVCGDDAIALGVLQTLRESNVRVPEDVRVTGFDDIELAAMSSPPLTTVRQPTAELARTAVAMLERRIRSPRAAARMTLIKPSLIVRASTG